MYVEYESPFWWHSLSLVSCALQRRNGIQAKKSLVLDTLDLKLTTF
jgi:hypothetical protein